MVLSGEDLCEKICCCFSKRIYEAIENDPHSEIIAFYADFSEAFDKVPH